jgi:hypothetical protein
MAVMIGIAAAQRLKMRSWLRTAAMTDIPSTCVGSRAIIVRGNPGLTPETFDYDSGKDDDAEQQYDIKGSHDALPGTLHICRQRARRRTGHWVAASG